MSFRLPIKNESLPPLRNEAASPTTAPAVPPHKYQFEIDIGSHRRTRALALCFSLASRDGCWSKLAGSATRRAALGVLQTLWSSASKPVFKIPGNTQQRDPAHHHVMTTLWKHLGRVCISSTCRPDAGRHIERSSNMVCKT